MHCELGIHKTLASGSSRFLFYWVSWGIRAISFPQGFILGIFKFTEKLKEEFNGHVYPFALLTFCHVCVLLFSEPFGSKVQMSWHSPRNTSADIAQEKQHSPMEAWYMLAYLRNQTFIHLMCSLYSNFPNCSHMPFMTVQNCKSRIQSKFTHCVWLFCLFNLSSSRRVPPLFVYCLFSTGLFRRAQAGCLGDCTPLCLCWFPPN